MLPRYSHFRTALLGIAVILAIHSGKARSDESEAHDAEIDSPWPQNLIEGGRYLFIQTDVGVDRHSLVSDKSRVDAFKSILTAKSIPYVGKGFLTGSFYIILLDPSKKPLLAAMYYKAPRGLGWRLSPVENWGFNGTNIIFNAKRFSMPGTWNADIHDYKRYGWSVTNGDFIFGQKPQP